MSQIDTTTIDEIIQEFGRGPSVVIPILQAIQKRYGYLPQEALEYVCQVTEITPAAIAGVSTFYSQFRHRPVGKHMISLCNGTACHVKGADSVFQAIRRNLKIAEGDDTDPEGVFTLEKVACLGCCTLAPAVQIDDVTYGHQNRETVPGMLRDFLELSKKRAAKPHRKVILEGDPGARGEIRVGLGSCCVARGSGKLHEALQQALVETNIQVEVRHVGCVGMCHQTPLLEIVPPGVVGKSFLYAQVEPGDAKAILLRHFKPRGVMRKFSAAVSETLGNMITDEKWQPVTRYSIDVRDKPVSAFLDKQRHLATEHCGVMEPTDLDAYIEKYDGFKALKHCLDHLTPQEVIEQVRDSQLRGRGGAGFPTGVKWGMVRAAEGSKKYIICNGDEGDPGAFMDRMLLESYPYRVIEGIAIAAYAVGADEGYFYIRAEYPLAVRRITEALQRCQEKGLLGHKIFDSHFSLRLNIMEGAGAFVCGEESALLASLEGKRGMPRLRPPYPSQKGYRDCPTLVNNVETYSLVPWIMAHSAADFSAMGTEKSKGTKVFALAGKVARGGLIEVPMGITMREIVEEIGGGVAGGKRFKAVQVGGPSGGCVPAELGHLSVDYESLSSVGAIMGSGGLVVLDEDDCMVDIARYFLEFTQDQSCGKCTWCRIGTRRMLDILENLCGGRGKASDLDELEELARNVKKGSICGLGQTAPNPVLSTLKYFRHEYEAHLQKRCPAGKCTALITYAITDDCIGCTKCAQHCPVEAIAMTPYKKHEIDTEKCIRCNTCKTVCPVNAVLVE